MNTFGKLLIKMLFTVLQLVNLFFNGDRQLIRAYGLLTCLTCGRDFTSDVFIETGGTEEYVSGSVISLEADLAEQRLILWTAGWLTSESCFGNWNKLIPAP